jgi:hypothetical protein
MKNARRRIEVNLEELDRVLDGARQAPLSEEDHHKLREALHALAATLVRPRSTEKTSSVVEKPEDPAGDRRKERAEMFRRQPARLLLNPRNCLGTDHRYSFGWWLPLYYGLVDLGMNQGCG